LVGRSETPLDPTSGPLAAFAHELRQLRRAAGSPSYRALARRAGYSAAALSAAASGSAFPSLSVTLAYVGACGGHAGEWTRRWQELDAKLAAERTVAPVPRSAPHAARALPPPRELPSDVYGFVGRADELARMDRVLDSASRSAVPILALSGTAGVGKTALAVHWAHRVADRYPDGQLYVDLRGYGPDHPAEPGEALAGFLRSLGVEATDIPYDEAERAARYRSLLAGRRILVLVDNAHDTESVRSLLPGAPSCAVVVTSRDTLAGLVARDGARRIDVPRLPEREAVRLLATLVGERVEAEPAAATAFVEGCARLPLALRVAAELAVTRPGATLADLVAELGDEQRRLKVLDTGVDERTAVGTVLSWSYRWLPEPVAALFRLLGRHPGPGLDDRAAAALGGVALDEARHRMAILVRAHLVEPTGAGQYGQHDLLRAYATQLSTVEDPAEVRQAALTRLLDHYLASAVAAMDLVEPAERATRPRGAYTHVPPPLSAPPAARDWLDAQRPTLVAAVAFAAEYGWPEHAAGLAATLWRYLDGGGHYPDALAVQRHALHAARARGDRNGEAAALHHIATVYRRWGRYGDAAEYYREALAIQRDLGDRAAAGTSLASLGVVNRLLGRYPEAIERYEQALAIHREVGDRTGVGRVLGNLAIVYDQLGRYAEAVDHYERALAILRELDNRAWAGITLGNLGGAYGRLGRYADAVAHLDQALDLLRAVGDRGAEADVLDELGLVHHRWGGTERAYGYLTAALEMHRDLGSREGEAVALSHLGAAYARGGRFDDALRHGRQALDIAREIGDRRVEAGALAGLGEAVTGLGQPHAALGHLESALALAESLDDRYGRARALEGLGRALAALDRGTEARRRFTEALALLADLDVPETAALRELVDATC
jgi:tetratricopeptide (TPR) repeat protein